MKNECSGFFGRIFGHDFQSVTDDSSPPISVEMIKVLSEAADKNGEWVGTLIGKCSAGKGKYLFDICTRCGLKIQRDENVSVKCQHCGGFTGK